MPYRGCACTLPTTWLAWVLVDVLLWLIALGAWAVHGYWIVRARLAAREP